VTYSDKGNVEILTGNQDQQVTTAAFVSQE